MRPDFVLALLDALAAICRGLTGGVPIGAPRLRLIFCRRVVEVCMSELGERKRAIKLKQTLALQLEPLQDIRKYLKIIKNNHSSN